MHAGRTKWDTGCSPCSANTIGHLVNEQADSRLSATDRNGIVTRFIWRLGKQKPCRLNEPDPRFRNWLTQCDLRLHSTKEAAHRPGSEPRAGPYTTPRIRNMVPTACPMRRWRRTGESNDSP